MCGEVHCGEVEALVFVERLSCSKWCFMCGGLHCGEVEALVSLER